LLVVTALKLLFFDGEADNLEIQWRLALSLIGSD
jgi:hypothetical protein